MRMLSLFTALTPNCRNVVRAGLVELLLAHALAEDRVPALHVLGTVGAVDAGAQLEVPLRRRGVDPMELLHLRVSDFQDHVESATPIAGGRDLLFRIHGSRCSKNLDIAQDDAGELDSGCAAGAERGDEIDLVALLKCSGEQVVLAGVDLDRALDAGELSLDPPLRLRREA